LRSAAMPYAVCAYCQTVILRDGDEFREIGKSAVLPFDVSPIQLATVVMSGDQRLEVIGRARWGWEFGSWNEWLLRGQDLSQHWLGEAMGTFMLLSEKPEILESSVAKAFAAGEAISPGSTIDIGDDAFEASDIKQARCLGGEGDLPFPTTSDWTIASVDFRSSDGSALNLQRDAKGVTAWLGAYYDLAGLKPSNLRTIDGWRIPVGLK